MVINIRIIDRTLAKSDDPLGRDWYGYDPAATPEQLWKNNRGDWSLNDKNISAQRWAALNYQDRIVLVAELHGPHQSVVVDARTGKSKKALVGHVLSDGHPMHTALIGSEVEYRRNPVSYDPDPETAGALEAALPDGETRDAPGAAGQGLQMDAAVRKAIENAAQDRLMQYYSDRGFTVTDTRLNSPYDAVAVRGTELIYLEAKGTQSCGDSVIVTRNEVHHARQHPEQCVMGVWSGMRLVNGQVDPDAGVFKRVNFNPEDRQLRPRDFDWALPSNETNELTACG